LLPSSPSLFKINACGNDLDPKKGFRVLVIFLGVCLGKKARSKYYLKDQAAARSQRVKMYFNPTVTVLTWLTIFFTNLSIKIAENHLPEKICNFRPFSV